MCVCVCVCVHIKLHDLCKKKKVTQHESPTHCMRQCKTVIGTYYILYYNRFGKFVFCFLLHCFHYLPILEIKKIRTVYQALIETIINCGITIWVPQMQH